MEQKQDEEIVAGALRVLALILGEHAVQVPTGEKKRTPKKKLQTQKKHKKASYIVSLAWRSRRELFLWLGVRGFYSIIHV